MGTEGEYDPSASFSGGLNQSGTNGEVGSTSGTGSASAPGRQATLSPLGEFMGFKLGQQAGVSPGNNARDRQLADTQQAPRSVSATGDSLVAENGQIRHYDANGTLLGSFPFTSGKDGVVDPSVKDKGPIPPGEYTLNTGDISEVHGLRRIVRNWSGDWGSYRAPLVPAPETNTHGRDNFFIHGGDTPGSKGCIDVGRFDRYLFPSLRERSGSMRLTVK